MSLQIENLSKRFESASEDTLQGITLAIEDGEFVCVIGPSGCGKTTLLNIIAGLEKPSGGSVTLDGMTVECAGADRVVLFQEAALFPWLTVIENVMFGLKLTGVKKVEQAEIAQRWLRLVNLAHYSYHRPHQLSGGMKQRVALARALALNSRILLMDEPFAALDKQTRNRMREELQRIWQETKKTVFFITHSVEEAVFLADKVIVMSSNPGKITHEVTVGLPRPRHIEAQDFIKLRIELLGKIRTEVDKSVEQEYRND